MDVRWAAGAWRSRVTDPDLFEEQARVGDSRGLTDRAVAGDLMEPIRLAVIPIRQATVEASSARDGGEGMFLTEDSLAR